MQKKRDLTLRQVTLKFQSLEMRPTEKFQLAALVMKNKKRWLTSPIWKLEFQIKT